VKGTAIVSLLVAAVGGTWLWLVRELPAGKEWPGVDEAVIGGFAEQAGRGDVQPLFSWIEGDLLLFMFLCAGLGAGFLLGYFARVLFVEQRDNA
jgi:hypothetical protein